MIRLECSVSDSSIWTITYFPASNSLFAHCPFTSRLCAARRCLSHPNCGTPNMTQRMLRKHAGPAWPTWVSPIWTCTLCTGPWHFSEQLHTMHWFLSPHVCRSLWNYIRQLRQSLCLLGGGRSWCLEGQMEVFVTLTHITEILGQPWRALWTKVWSKL